MAQGGLRQCRDAALDRLRVDMHLGSDAADADTFGAELLRCGVRELERVEPLQARLVTSAFDASRRAELVEQLGELPRGRVDHLDVLLLRLAQVAHPHERLREAVDRRQRRAQVVRGERHEARKAGICGGHRAA